MLGLMQDWPLTADKILDHAKAWHGDREIVTRTAEGPIVRTTYAEIHARAKKVSNALLRFGIKPGERVATFGWNGARHFEAWYGIIGIGAVCHTLNPRLFAEHLVYIVNHAIDRIILADAACAPILETILPQCPSVELVVFLTDAAHMPKTPYKALSYEDWIAGEDSICTWGGFEENTACGLCYTSGTTGNPKGVLYSHRSNYIHALMSLQHDALKLSARDTVLLIVPMYHANAWGIVYSAPAVGAKLVLPGQNMDGASIHELLETEGVTYSSAVPTVWQMLLTHLKETKGKLTTLQRVTVGGSACPELLIRTFHDDYGIDVFQGWGMTETSPLATVSVPDARVAQLSWDEQVAHKLKQGRLLCGLELKLVDDDGKRLPHDGKTFGRLKIKGATIARAYYGGEGGDPLDEEGFFDTGDVATIDATRIHADHRPRQGCDQVRRRMDQLDRGREHRRRPSQGGAGRRHRRRPSQMGRAADPDHRAQARRSADQGRDSRLPRRQDRQMVDAGRCPLRRQRALGRHRQDRQALHPQSPQDLQSAGLSRRGGPMPELKTRKLCSYYATLEPVQHDTGEAHMGKRMIAVVTGGAFEGERLKGTVLNGGGDWALIETPRDVLRLDARVTWQTHDGAKIYVSYRGVLKTLSEIRRQRAAGGTMSDDDFRSLYFRTTPVFETGDPRYAWLNDIVVVGMGGAIPDGVKYELFEVL